MSAKQDGERLDPDRTSDAVTTFQQELRARIVGQEEAIQEIVRSFAVLTSGLRDTERPLLTLLFMGPTGVGKTETVKVIADTLFGQRNAFTRINAQEFSSPHQVAKLLGAPPGYVGNEVEPMLSQKNIDRHHKEAFEGKRGIFRKGSGRVQKLFPLDTEHYLSLILFDEIEKADPALWNSLLGILDDGHLTLGNNERVDFTRSILILTSNVGSAQIGKTLRGSMGFHADTHNELDRQIADEALRAAKEVFPYEFLNRFDGILFFKTLGSGNLHRILDLYLWDLHARAVRSEIPFILDCSNPVRAWLVKQGSDPEFGARPLRRAFAKHIVHPLSNLLSSGQVKPGDLVRAAMRGGRVTFARETRTDRGIVVPHPQRRKAAKGGA